MCLFVCVRACVCLQNPDAVSDSWAYIALSSHVGLSCVCVCVCACACELCVCLLACMCVCVCRGVVFHSLISPAGFCALLRLSN